MQERILKVLIVDDSTADRELLREIIESDPHLKVIAVAENGEKALSLLEILKPDVITMDICMPGIDGLEVTRQIMRKNPIPIIIVSGAFSSQNVEDSFKAINAGALAIVSKPVRKNEPFFQKKSKEIIEAIKVSGEIKLITRRKPSDKEPEIKEPLQVEAKKTIKAVGIGASLGGPPALVAILKNLAADFPVPIFIVQHIASGFAKGLVDWLSEFTPLKIELGENGKVAQAGTVYVAPDMHHMEVGPGDQIQLISESKNGLQPCVANLFNSMAKTYGGNCIAILLTGMGRDGALEMLQLKEKGAITLAQDEASSIIFGMPKAAIDLGAVNHVVALNDIARLLKTLVYSNEK